MDLRLGQLSGEDAHFVHFPVEVPAVVAAFAEEEVGGIRCALADFGIHQLAVHVEQQGGAVVAGRDVVPGGILGGGIGVGDRRGLPLCFSDAERHPAARGGGQGVHPPVFTDIAAQVHYPGPVVGPAELDPGRDGKGAAGILVVVLRERGAQGVEVHGGAKGRRKGDDGADHRVAAEGRHLSEDSTVGIEKPEGAAPETFPELAHAGHFVGVELAGQHVEIHERLDFTAHGGQQGPVAVEVEGGRRRAQGVCRPVDLDAVGQVALGGAHRWCGGRLQEAGPEAEGAVVVYPDEVVAHDGLADGEVRAGDGVAAVGHTAVVKEHLPAEHVVGAQLHTVGRYGGVQPRATRLDEYPVAVVVHPVAVFSSPWFDGGVAVVTVAPERDPTRYGGTGIQGLALIAVLVAIGVEVVGGTLLDGHGRTFGFRARRLGTDHAVRTARPDNDLRTGRPVGPQIGIPSACGEYGAVAACQGPADDYRYRGNRDRF